MFKKLKGHQGVEKLLLTQHILHAHYTSQRIMVAGLSARPITLDPVTLGWRQLDPDGHYIPGVLKVPGCRGTCEVSMRRQQVQWTVLLKGTSSLYRALQV